MRAEKAQAEYQELVSQILADIKHLGATGEVHLSEQSGFSTTVRLGSVETLEFNHDKSLSLTIYKDHKKGSVSTTDFHQNAILACIEAAFRIADYTESDPFAGLAESQTMAGEIPNLDLSHPWVLAPETAIRYAKECEEAARAVDKRISNSEGASLASHQRLRVYGNTHGFLSSYPSSRHSLSCAVIGQDKGSMQRDYDYTTSRNPDTLENLILVGKRAAEKTLRRLNARKIKTCTAPILFDANIAPGLWGSLISAISGGNLYRKSSFLLDSVGKTILPNFVHIEEQPHLKQGLGSAPFDADGVATTQHHIVQAGVLKSYILSSYAARRLGLKTTGNAGGVHNLVLSHNNLDQKALLKKMDKGLLVTELMGQGINLVTGDYSRGASGFWVENGEIQYPVEEITIAGNLRDMFLNMVAIGSDIEKRSNILTGSVLLEKMTIAGN